jgi:hypothetical protein
MAKNVEFFFIYLLGRLFFLNLKASAQHTKKKSIE